MATDLWDWAVATYGRLGVAEQCLALQDEHGQCVPLLLWAAWRGVQVRAVDAELAAQAAFVARQWSSAVIAPLRDVRRRLKSSVSSTDDAVRLPLREKIKASELEAEKALMGLLAELGGRSEDEKPFSGQGIGAHIQPSLIAVARAWSLSPLSDVTKEALQALTHTLTKG